MKPILQALLLADRIYHEVRGKIIIVGVFNRLMFKKPPEPRAEDKAPSEEDEVIKSLADVQDAGNPWVYISLTDVKGEIPLELRYESLSGDNVIFRAELSVKSDNPVQTVEIVLPVPRLPTVVGNFVLDLLYKGESLGCHRVECIEVTNVRD